MFQIFAANRVQLQTTQQRRSLPASLAWIIALISFIIWRQGVQIRNFLLFKSKFPPGYYHAGNYSEHCEFVGGNQPDPAFKYCEGAVFWNTFGADRELHQRHILMSCDSGRKQWNTVMGPLQDPEPHGSLWLFTSSTRAASDGIGGAHSFTSPRSLPRRIQLNGFPTGHDFHPLGIDISPSYEDQASVLFVINHARARSVIEQFEISPSNPTEATYVRTITSPFLLSPNSISITSPNSFYVSNDHGFTKRLPIIGRFIPITETILALPFSFVSHIQLHPPSTDSKEVNHVQKHNFAAIFLTFANGIALSRSGSELAIASSNGGKIYLYKRDVNTNILTPPSHGIHVPFAPDNLMYDDNENIIVAGHPHFPTLVSVAASKGETIAPSWVVSLQKRPLSEENIDSQFDLAAPISASQKIAPDSQYSMTSLMQSDGTWLSSSSDALLDSTTGRLFIAGIYDLRGVAMCDPNGIPV